MSVNGLTFESVQKLHENAENFLRDFDYFDVFGTRQTLRKCGTVGIFLPYGNIGGKE